MKRLDHGWKEYQQFCTTVIKSSDNNALTHSVPSTFLQQLQQTQWFLVEQCGKRGRQLCKPSDMCMPTAEIVGGYKE